MKEGGGYIIMLLGEKGGYTKMSSAKFGCLFFAINTGYTTRRHWLPHSYDLGLHLSKKLSKLLLKEDIELQTVMVRKIN